MEEDLQEYGGVEDRSKAIVALPAQRITIHLVAQQCLSEGERDLANETTIDRLVAITSLDLSWQRIERIESLELFSNLRELYIQHNSISVVEGLDHLVSLELLALSHNRIATVEDGALSSLSSLLILDLSYNCLEETLEPTCLPASLQSFDIRGNVKLESVEIDLLELYEATLPNLLEFNGEHIEKNVASDVSMYVNDSRPIDDVVLHVTVEDFDGSGAKHVVKLKFSVHDDIYAIATAFCIEHMMQEDTSALIDLMKDALFSKDTYSHDESQEYEDSNDHVGSYSDVYGVKEQKENMSDYEREKVATDNALKTLESAHVQFIEESEALFKQEKERILSDARAKVSSLLAETRAGSVPGSAALELAMSQARDQLTKAKSDREKDDKLFTEQLRIKAENAMSNRRLGRQIKS